jgi:hypothetical protein
MKLRSWFRARRERAGFVGMSPNDAARTHFFQWFALRPEGSGASGAIVFRPSGAKFHDLASVVVATGSGRGIEAIDLTIARSFIEDPQEGMFAADLGKSFLEAALPAEDLAAMRPLVDTIAHGGTYARPIISAAPGPGDVQIDRDSAPYLVWIGRSSDWQGPAGVVALRLENVTVDGAAALRIGVVASPSRQPRSV